MRGRKTGGRRKGSVNRKTTVKRLEEARDLEILKQLVLAELGPMTQAQIAHAKGVGYMVLRRPDGTFTRATDVKQIDAALAAGAGTFELFTQAPNTQAFSDLLNRTFGKPAESVTLTGADGGPLIVRWKS